MTTQDHDPKMRRAFQVMRSQAKFRDESWQLEWEEFVVLWTPELWNQRGKGSDDLTMTRIDNTKPWHKVNVKIVRRADHLASVTRKHRLGYRKQK
jgi:hypothetical protein